jgi:hypothetical protein
MAPVPVDTGPTPFVDGTTVTKHDVVTSVT